MIPYALFGAQWEIGDETIELCAEDLSVEGFRFRLALHHRAQIAQGGGKLTLRTSVPGRKGWKLVIGEDAYRIIREGETQFYDEYRMEIESHGYQEEMRGFMHAYSQYVSDKLTGSMAELSARMTGYPAHLEECFSEEPEAQKELWLQGIRDRWDPESSLWKDIPEVILVLDQPDQWEEMKELSWSDLAQKYFHKAHLSKHPLARRCVEQQSGTICIGGGRCGLLFPGEQTLPSILERIADMGCEMMVQLAPVPDRRYEKMIRCLQRMSEWCSENKRSLDVIVNDWGMVEALKSRKELRCILGSRMVKYRKDVRLDYICPESEQRKLGDHPGQPKRYIRSLKEEENVNGLLFESAGYEMQVEETLSLLENSILRWPWFEMNAAGYCTLRAVCETGERGHQVPEDDCPGYCRKQTVIYPDFLKMTGRFNGLYGLDVRAVWDSDYLKRWMDQGMRRILIDWM